MIKFTKPTCQVLKLERDPLHLNRQPVKTQPSKVPRSHESVPFDAYIFDVLIRDLVGHDQHPSAFLVYLCLYSQAARADWKPVPASLRTLAESTGLSKSAVQRALERLHRRELITTTTKYSTATPRHLPLRPWQR